MSYFTIDLEEWWRVESFKELLKSNSISFNDDDRINQGLKPIVRLLKNYDQPCTFFVLGSVAEKYPEIIVQLKDLGFDIGTHGYNHELVYNQDTCEFEEDLIRSLDAIEKACSIRPRQYRAPSYSITKRSLWALNVLSKHGIFIDSSISPAPNSRFGISGVSHQPYKIITENGILYEVPPNASKVLGRFLPITSGFAFRLFPMFFIKSSIKGFPKKNIKPMIILHNWEFDPKHPKLPVSLKGRLIHYFNLNNTEKRVDSLFKEFRFENLREIPEPELTYRLENERLVKES